jgi:hypothetical protein
MELWVRSYEFLEGSKYKSEHDKLRKFLLENQNKKVLFLELGVGLMTPMFIKEPFWNMTYSWPDAYYITINPNPEHALLPKELKDKGLAMHEDIAQVLGDLVSHMQRFNSLGDQTSSKVYKNGESLHGRKIS